MALTKTDVSALYVAIFNRASEGEGNTFWQTAGTSAEVANAMLETAPAKEYFGAALDDDQAFIEHIYLNTLGKTLADDAEGIEFWTGELATQSRGEVIARLIESALDAATAGPAQDKFKNMIAVSDFAADTLEDAPADLGVLRFDAGLQGVTADPATVEAAKAKVDQVLNPVDPVIAALQEVQAARKAVNDFLFDAAQTDETPEEDEALTEEDLEAALKEAEDELAENDYAVTAKFDATESAALQESKLNTAKLAAAEVVADAQEAADKALDAAAKVPGLVAAMLAVQARRDELEAAEKATVPAEQAFNAAEASYETIYTDAPTVTEGDKLIVNPAITNAAQKAEANKVLAAEVALAQANAAVIAAGEAVSKAELVVVFADAEKGAKNALFDLVTGNDPADEAGNNTAGRGDSLTHAQYEAALAVAKGKLAAAEEAEDTDAAAEAQVLVNGLQAAFGGFVSGNLEPATATALVEAREALEAVQEAEKDLLDLIAARDEAQAQLDQLEELQAAVDAAEKALEDTGFEVIHLDEVAVAGTAGDDVFVLYGDDSSIYNFNAQGSDKLYVGGDFKLVTLGADQKITDERLGDSAELEIFIKQDGANTVLYVEEQTFAGNRADSNDLVEITLNGVTASDLVLEDGFLSIA